MTKRTDVAILTFEGLPLYEFSCAIEMFALSRPGLGELYRCEALAVDAAQINATGGVQVEVKRDVKALMEFGTVVVPGWPLSRTDIPQDLAEGIRSVYANDGRLISICSGSFLLAELGLLDDKPAVTHWLYRDELLRRYPRVRYQGNVLYTQDQQIYTSAGSSAGLDLCLHIVREDYGFEKARQVARRLVMSPHRAGGQAQYVEQPLQRHYDHLSDALDWARARLHQVITIDNLAQKACLSRRSFDRQFRASLGLSPKQWLIQQRVRCAKELLEATALDIEQVAIQAGFGKAINLRHHFKSQLHLSPTQYRQQFSQPDQN